MLLLIDDDDDDDEDGLLPSRGAGLRFSVSRWRYSHVQSGQSWRSRATQTARDTRLTRPADWQLTSIGLSESFRMGCAISGSGVTPRTAESRNTEDEAPARLTPDHIQLIKESWKVIQEDIAKVGIIMFVRWEFSFELLHFTPLRFICRAPFVIYKHLKQLYRKCMFQLVY